MGNPPDICHGTKVRPPACRRGHNQCTEKHNRRWHASKHCCAQTTNNSRACERGPLQHMHGAPPPLTMCQRGRSPGDQTHCARALWGLRGEAVWCIAWQAWPLDRSKVMRASQRTPLRLHPPSPHLASWRADFHLPPCSWWAPSSRLLGGVLVGRFE